MIYRVLLAVMLLALNSTATAEESLKGLLNTVKQVVEQDRITDANRLKTFQAEEAKQAELLAQAKARLAKAEARQTELKAEFEANREQLADQRILLDARSAQLGEVFGVVREVAKTTTDSLRDSLMNAQYPDRLRSLAFARQERVPSPTELRALWFALQQEITASGQIERFEAPVVDRQGETKTHRVTRVGPFVALDEQGQFLSFDPERQNLSVFPTQPDFHARTEAQAFVNGTGHQVTIDPSRGNLLHMLSLTPSLEARLHQGGMVAYIILALGALGLLIAFVRLIGTTIVSFRVSRQLKRPQQPNAKNPLGRLMLSAKGAASFEDVSLKVDEALLGEVPSLERGLALLKLLAAVAPLLGLLGTVTGMIGTFQSITLFGNSDPKLMAGGISQALITTVLGLCAAIPLLFCHSFLAARTRRLLQLLQQKSLALMIEQQEQPHTASVSEVQRAA